MTPFSPETFLRRREEVMKGLEDGVLILSSSPLLFRSRDTELPYRPDSELFYLTGCTEPDVVAVFRGGSEDDRFILFVPRRDPKRELWSGFRMGPEEAREKLGADAAFPVEEVETRLGEILKEPRRIFFRLGGRPRLQRVVEKALQAGRARGARRGVGPRSVEDPGELLDEFRVRKDPEEIAVIRKATEITVEAFREAMAGTGPGKGEWEVEALLEVGFRLRGASGPAFPTIVGSGSNGCVLHYADNRRRIGEGELVLVDGGAEVDLYAGDVSRTFPSGGRFSHPQRALYEVVVEAHGRAVEAVKPGRTIADIHGLVQKALTGGLVALGVLEGDVEELVDRKAFERYFPHQTSHWLGLDVHDVGDYAREGSSRVLEPGMVLTIEPGLYFAPTPEEVPGPFTGLGIRVEDDVLVTEKGGENLTEALPVLPEEVEELVGARQE